MQHRRICLFLDPPLFRVELRWAAVISRVGWGMQTRPAAHLTRPEAALVKFKPRWRSTEGGQLKSQTADRISENILQVLWSDLCDALLVYWRFTDQRVNFLVSRSYNFEKDVGGIWAKTLVMIGITSVTWQRNMFAAFDLLISCVAVAECDGNEACEVRGSRLRGSEAQKTPDGCQRDAFVAIGPDCSTSRKHPVEILMTRSEKITALLHSPFSAPPWQLPATAGCQCSTETDVWLQVRDCRWSSTS